MFAFLSTWWIKAVAIVAAAAALVGGGIFLTNTWYERGVAAQKELDATAAQRQATIDQTHITEAVHANDQELLELRAYRDSHPAVPVGVCHEASVPGDARQAAPGAHGGPAPAVVVQSVPQPDPHSDLSDADRGAMLQSLAAAADTYSAQLRAVQAAVK